VEANSLAGLKLGAYPDGHDESCPYKNVNGQKNMRHKVLDGVEVWKQFEDLLIPRLRLSVIERALYSHLLRHSRLEGKPRVRFSIPGLTRVAGLTRWMIRKGLRRLLAKGALRLAEKGKWGHTIEVRLPEEVRAVRARNIAARKTQPQPSVANLNPEEADFLATRALLLLPATNDAGHTVPRPRVATRVDGKQFLPQPGFELRGMQFAERRTEG
jgi:hypothetical protein